LPPDVRKASGFPRDIPFLNGGEAQPRRFYIKRKPMERRSLSAHQAAEPRTLNLSSSPVDASNINGQRFIVKPASLPNPNARPPIVLGSINQFSFHRILVNVIRFLNAHALAEDWKRVVVVLPKGVYVTMRSTFSSQLPK
jgi:hypothetical protein